MVFNTTFNNISAISWRSVLLLEKTGVPGENYHLSVARRWQTLTHNVVLSTPRHERGSNSQRNPSTIRSRSRRHRKEHWKKKEWKNILPASFDVFPGCIYIKLFICKSPNNFTVENCNIFSYNYWSSEVRQYQASFRFPRGNNLIMDLENIMYILFSLFFSE
jgi:hypothetical protein